MQKTQLSVIGKKRFLAAILTNANLGINLMIIHVHMPYKKKDVVDSAWNDLEALSVSTYIEYKE
jgi:hypothetical protein